MISVFGALLGEEELAQVRESTEAQWLGMGPKVKAFEAAFAERLGVPSFAMLDSGSNSLQLALRLLDLPQGSEVIVPAFTWVSCAHAVLLNGCRPVFCDVELETQNVSAETVAPHITPRTGAIMVVHYAGKPVDMDAILATGLPVIEDAAHAVDSSVDGRACGSLGAVGVFSFDPVKNLATCEAGGITSLDEALVQRAKELRYCGIAKSGFEASASGKRWWEYAIADCMPKFLPNDVSAGIALAQLEKLDRLQARRREVWEVYQQELADIHWLSRPLDAGPGETHSYFTYCIRVAGGRRDALARHLLDRRIYTTLRYHPLHLNPIYGDQTALPIAERLNEEALSLPIHPRLTDQDVERILSALRDFTF